MSVLRFSGHDTFHCREQWLLKGLNLIEKKDESLSFEGGISNFKVNSAIPELGVGKNMVRSIAHWIRAFKIFDDQSNEIGELSKILFQDLALDPYLENEGSLWLMQYYLCSTEYASIFKLIFSDYFSDKASLEFSESQVKSFLHREIERNNQRSVTDNTLNSDFKVFIKTYVAPKKNIKTVEDDFNTPLLALNLVFSTGRRNEKNEPIFRINRTVQKSLTPEIFGYCLLAEFQGNSAIDYDKIRTSVASYLCLSNEGLERIIDNLGESYPEFIYKDDAGVRQIQVKNTSEKFKINLLKKHYELHS
ncbi:Protein of unknown function [Salinimicrobium sediminis]|uniref:DUF4007 domain-containing protein n=1 Tax=Salinimicrobium sediminis TaxID=1343891 RepID=A0A285X8B0_9FLAO|nr:DUF4007 family protein [Salinimicrobium sediminis]SOC81570.1 Protein of unknown function [Salinimicrobium sediminis]